MKKLILLLFIPLIFGCSLSNEEMEIVIKNEIIKTLERDNNLRYFYLEVDSIKKLKEFKKEFFGSLQLIDKRITNLSEFEYDSEELFFEGEISDDTIYYGISGKYRAWEVKKFLTDLVRISSDFEVEQYVGYETLDYFYNYEIVDSYGKVFFTGATEILQNKKLKKTYKSTGEIDKNGEWVERIISNYSDGKEGGAITTEKKVN